MINIKQQWGKTQFVKISMDEIFAFQDKLDAVRDEPEKVWQVVDEFFNATKNLTDGSYTTEPVKSKFGYHIIIRVSKTEKEALENMKDDLMNEIIDSKLANDSNLYNTTWGEIRKNYNLKINDTTIESYYNKLIAG